jgi:uncharacterized membrane protein
VIAVMAPTPMDIHNLAAWVITVLSVATVLGFIGWSFDRAVGALVKMRVDDTPEPERRQQLNSVIQFPQDRWQ